MIFVANPVISCFESAILMLLLGVWQIQPLGHTGSGGGGGTKEQEVAENIGFST